MAALAPSRMQNDIHPLLRHPKPIKRDFAKAQRMLGLVADNEEHLKRLQREKSVTTRWLERPLYEYLDMLDMESEKEDMECEVKTEPVHDGIELGGGMDMAYRPDQANQPTSNRSFLEPMITSGWAVTQKRPVPIACPQPNFYDTQQLLTPERCASPSMISPDRQRPRPISMQPKSPSIEKTRPAPNVNIKSSLRTTHIDLWNPTPTQHGTNKRTERAMSFQPQGSASLSILTVNEPARRPRPSSFATYSRARNRSNSKIASSRGLRNHSYPNFSRPISGIASKVVPGEEMEKDTLCPQHSNDTPVPVYPSPTICPALRDLEQDDDHDKNKGERKSRNRWSAIPDTLKKLTKRRPSAVAYDGPDLEVKIEALRWANFTNENLHAQKSDSSQTSFTPGTRFLSPALLPTPTSSPLDIKHPLFEPPLPRPFAPWANSPPSPATSVNKSSGSPVSPISSTKRNAPSRLSIESLARIRPTSLHSLQSIVVSPLTSSPHITTPRRGTPTLERTCILCKTPKSPTDFVNRITENCWHEPATCVDCLQDWIETFFDTHRSNRCPCPECGENMTYEDIGAFADVVNL